MAETTEGEIMKTGFNFKGKGKTLGVGALILAVVGVWVMGYQEQKNKAERDAERDARLEAAFPFENRWVGDSGLSSQILYKHVENRIAEIRQFVEVPIGTGNSWNPDASEPLDRKDYDEYTVLSAMAHCEIEALPGRQQTNGAHARIAKKCIEKFDAWLNPKWEQVKKAGPGKASWHLRFETDPAPRWDCK